MASFKDAEEAKEDYLSKKHRRAYYLGRSILIFVFFVCVPYLQAPAWCLQSFHDSGERSFGAIDCSSVSTATGIRGDGLPAFSPLLTCLVDFVCLILFCVMACMENKWRNQSKGERARVALLIICCAVTAIDLVRCWLAYKYPYIGNLMRVGILFTYSSNVRTRMKSLMSDLVDSFDILMTIFTYILVFTLTVYYFYRSTFEGFQNFGTIKDAYRNMTILFTTANFPDVFLPAMNINYFNAFLFMFFMLLGLYFLTNLLLANVFNKYERRLQNKRQKRIDKRMEYIETIFFRYDKDKSGVLEHMEAKEFLANVFDFDYHNDVHRNTAKKILEIVDVDNN